MVTNDWIGTPHLLDRSSSQFPDHRAWRESDECIKSPEINHLARIVDDLDKVLDGLSPGSFAFKRTHCELQKICISQKLLPSSHVLNQEGLNVDKYPFVSGDFFDVYKGRYNSLGVCIKKLRITPDTDSELATKILFREALPWKRSIHPNIVPFVGVIIDPPQIASEWMPGGHLTAYIKSHPNQDPVSLLVDVAKGLDYMHSHGMIHGDLKGPNILVDDSGHARITDFGLVQDTSSVVSIAEGQSTRWTAPEILEETGIPSTEADVFSFGMVMVEALTGTVPFSDRTSPAAMMAILSRKRPPRPAHSSLTDMFWELMKRCWDQDRHSRPQMLEVLLALGPPDHERTHASGPLPATADVPTLVADIRQLLENRDPSNKEHRPLLYVLLTHRDLKPCIDGFGKDDLQEFVELLDEALENIPVTDDLFRKTLRKLQSTCGNFEVLPRSYHIPGGSLSNWGKPFAAGGSADARGAEFSNRKKVWITTLRSDIQRKTLYRGIIVWKRLQHPNVVPFLGILSDMPPFEMVHDWMEHGSITEYMKKIPTVDQIDLLRDVAEGLHHLHSYNVVHGDMKGANVLIDENGHARLADFGLASIVLGNQSVASLPDANLTIATTWAAPEISMGGSLTKAGDVFAFAMVAAEAFTEHPLPIKCYAAVSTGERPEQPAKLDNDLWDLMQSCWNRDPGKRPSSLRLVNFFRPSLWREREIWETQSLSSAASDRTLAYPESKNAGSHSDPPAVKPEIGRDGLEVQGNTLDLDPRHQIPVWKLKSPPTQDQRPGTTGKRTGFTTTVSNPNIVHNSTTPESGPPALEQRQLLILKEKVDRRPQAKDIDRLEGRQKFLEERVDQRPQAEDIGELEVRRKILEEKVDQRPQAEDIGELEVRRKILEKEVDRRPKAEDIGQLEARQKILEKKVDRRPPAKDIEARQKILQDKLELSPEAKDVRRGIVSESVGGRSWW